MHSAARAALGSALLAALAVGSPELHAQASPPQPGQAPWSRMHALVQKTVFKVDVLTLDLCFDSPTAQRFAAVAARGPLEGGAADSIARIALAGARAFARIEFVRDVSLDRFLGGVNDELRNARDRGLLADSVYRTIRAGLPEWYGFARQRGIRKGDRLMYQFEPDRVRTVFIGREGRTLLDQVSEGRARRNSPLASYLAPGSDFRASLLQSLARDGARAGTPASAARCRLPAS